MKYRHLQQFAISPLSSLLSPQSSTPLHKCEDETHILLLHRKSHSKKNVIEYIILTDYR